MLQNIFLEKVCIHEQLVYKKYYLSHDSFLRSTEEEDDVTRADKAVQVESTVAALATAGQQQQHPSTITTKTLSTLLWENKQLHQQLEL